MRILSLSLFLFFSFTGTIFSQKKVEVVRFEKLQNLLKQNSEKLTIVNFWATWCEPCLAEIPHFVEVYNNYQNKFPLDIIFVSLDRHRDLSHVNTFVEKHQMPGRLVLLNDLRRMNQWIPKIHPDWQGTLPATGFYRNGTLQEFYPNALNKEELRAIIERLSFLPDRSAHPMEYPTDRQ